MGRMGESECRATPNVIAPRFVRGAIDSPRVRLYRARPKVDAFFEYEYTVSAPVGNRIVRDFARRETAYRI